MKPAYKFKNIAVPAFIILVVTVFVYLPVADNGFINLDSWDYYYKNDRVLQGLSLDGIFWAFQTQSMSNWHPVTWLSYMLDAELYGPSAKGPHLTNLIIHMANSQLLLFFLVTATGRLWPSFFVAMLFSIHPTQVESVAWIAERKDVLFGFFFFAGLIFYLKYLHQKSIKNYFLVLCAFSLGLMSKPMMVTFPFVLLLLDYWPLIAQHKKPFDFIVFIELLKEKIPFFALTLLFCYLTYTAQLASGAMNGGAEISLGLRLENAFVAYAAYIKKAFLPTDLAVFYPHPGQWATHTVFAALGLIAIPVIISLRFIKQAPAIFVGFGWFFGSLVPVIGLVQVGLQAYADRYTYIPYVGFFLACVFGLDYVRTNFKLQQSLFVWSAVAMCCVFSGLTHLYVQQWQSSIVLWRHSLFSTDVNYPSVVGISSDPVITSGQPRTLSFSYIMLGLALMQHGRFHSALIHFNHAGSLGMVEPRGWYWRGHALLALGHTAEAAKSFSVFLNSTAESDSYREDAESLLKEYASNAGFPEQ